MKYPQDDGWKWLYRFYHDYIARYAWLRKLINGYFGLKTFELAGKGKLYRLLGVHVFGRFIPTGGVAIRRTTGARMAPYTLRDISMQAALDFSYRSCIFEALHMPFFLALLGLSAYRLSQGRLDLALENMLVNLVINIYPMMHQRYTRVRIDILRQKWIARNSLTAHSLNFPQRTQN